MIINLKNVTVFTVKVHYLLNETSSWNFDHTFEISAYFAIGSPTIISNVLDEQVMMKKGDMLKSDIIKFLTNRFILDLTDYSELKDNKGNYYRIIDMNDPYEPVTLSDLLEPAVEFVSSGIKSGDFEEEDMNTALTAITNWVSLEMNQKKKQQAKTKAKHEKAMAKQKNQQERSEKKL